MNIIENKVFDEERALYESKDLKLVNCGFHGKADGESALKESSNIIADHCFCDLRYPFWHNHSLKISNSEMTANCRAALWYSDNVIIANTSLHGIKAVRECENVTIEDCDISSPEFGWFSKKILMSNCRAESEYFLLRSRDITLKNVDFKGKYSFQYIENAVLENCIFDTKDAFWHAKNVVVRDSVVKGEYLGWYSDNLVFDNCKITGTQPLCYCEKLKLINCEMENTDLSFEKSDVTAEILTPIDSVKNPRSGRITAPEIGTVIRDDEESRCEIIIR